MITLADYHVATNGEAPAPSPGKLYTYIFAGDGVYIRARRAELSACARVATYAVRGLPPVTPFLSLHLPRVPEKITRACFNRARSVCVGAGRPREVLLYLIHDETGWRMVEPDQEADGSSCRPTDPCNEDGVRSIIELHSHHEMRAFWSGPASVEGTDDHDEQGFKLYAVMGRIFTTPTLRVRAGVYGHFVEVPACDVFELPTDVSGPAPQAEAAADEEDSGTGEYDTDDGAPVYRVGSLYLK